MPTKTTTTTTTTTTSTSATTHTNTTVLILGGGFAGICAGIKLIEAGVTDFIILEKATEIGGVWRENTYPGCACDVPSAFYSYSFAPNPAWSRVFARHSEIKQYLHQKAHAAGLTPHIHLNTAAVKSTWHADKALWEVETSKQTYSARFVIGAAGPLHEPNIPSIQGIEQFKGAVFHSAQWRHDIDLSNKRVAVIGTGASAIQFVPAIQPMVAKMTVFQRTPQWVLPKLDLSIPPAMRTLFSKVPLTQLALRTSIYAIFEGLNTSYHHPKAAGYIQKIAQWNLNKQIKQPNLRQKLTPNFTIGCKRVLQSSDWYSALQQPNVVVETNAIERITAEGVIDSSGTLHRADVIIYGTGFKTTDASSADAIFNDKGQSLSDIWQGTPQGYLGTVVHGFPNLLLMIGPNLAIGSTSALVIIEAQAGYMVSAIQQALANNYTLNVKASVQQTFNEQVQAALTNTVWNAGGCTSYYIDRNGVNSAVWPWSSIAMRRRLAHCQLSDFEVP